VSTVLVATTLGGVVGPNLVAVMGGLAGSWGIPPLAGPFLLAGAAYAVAGTVLSALLRPDPLLLARELAAAERTAPPGPASPPTEDPRPVSRGVALGAAVMVLTQLVMVAVMTMTPVHMAAHGHGLDAAGLVIAVHVAAMYLPSPVTGRLVDRVGRTRVAGAAGATLLLAGGLAAIAPEDSVVLLAIALALLGLGWNLGLVSGTAIVTDSVPPATRARTQGSVDVLIAVSGAGGGLASGLVVAAAGYGTLAIGGGILALAIIPIIALAARTQRTAELPAG
jgi:hypothetical protein